MRWVSRYDRFADRLSTTEALHWPHSLVSSCRFCHAQGTCCRSHWNNSVQANLLVSWCFEPSQPQRITSGLNTNFTLSPKLVISQVIIPQVMFVCVCVWFVFLGFFAYLCSAGTQHGNLHPAVWPSLFCGPTQEPVLAKANTGKKSGEVLEKMQVNGPEG